MQLIVLRRLTCYRLAKLSSVPKVPGLDTQPRELLSMERAATIAE
jgi:hypothetical protein